MHNALGVQVPSGGSNALRDVEGRFKTEIGAGRVYVAGAGGQAGRPGQVAKRFVNQLQYQPFGAGGVAVYFALHRNQVGVSPGFDAGQHFAVGQAVAGHRAFE